MDLYEILRVMYTRVQSLDPKNVSKIVGYLLLQDESEQEMLRLALSPDALLMSVVSRAKQELGMLNEPLSPQQQQQQTYHLLRNKLVNSTTFNSPVFQSRGASLHQYQQPFLSGGGVFPNDQFYPETFAFLNRSRVSQQQQHKVEEYDLSSEHGSPNSSSSSSSSSNNSGGSNTLSFSWKPCVYYSRGHCKHGSSCRFLHTPQSPGPVQETTSLERLEQEVYDILRSRKSPLLISSLQQLYYEEHGRLLQLEEGDESSNLMYLLCNSKRIHLLDHPNGQKAIALNVEDGSPRTPAAAVPYCSDNANSARQIYMTFPAESTFTEEDVNLHFSAYGHVHDVRIPYQLKRMFGFVTFQHPESVRTILAEGNPHYIRGARVLVKPYRDKVKHTEFRKNDDHQSKFSDLIALKLLDKNEMQLQHAADSKYQAGGTYLAAAAGHLGASRPDDILLRQGNCYNDVEEEFPSYTNRDSY